MGFISEIDIFNLKVGDVVYDYLNREVEIADKSVDCVKAYIRFGANCYTYKVFKNEDFGKEFTLLKSEKGKNAENNNNEQENKGRPGLVN